MRQWRLLLLLFALSAFVSLANAEKNVDDETVEGSANVDNPDDEEFDADQSSGLPPDDEKPQVREPEVPVVAVQPTPDPPALQPTTVIIQSGSVDSWSLDTTTLIILFGALLVVLLLIIVAVVCVRKRTNKQYTRGQRQPNAYV